MTRTPVTALDFTSCHTAQENMRFDDRLLLQAPAKQRIFRVYEWQSPGITFSYKQRLPESLQIIDHARRFTGGGIVFHSPGDIVFCCIIPQIDPLLGKRPKDFLSWIATSLQGSFTVVNIPVTCLNSVHQPNYEFCQTYPAPFELGIQGSKCVAMSLRRTRTHMMIQGIIHLSNPHLWIKSYGLNYPEASLYLPLKLRHIQSELIAAIVEKVR